MSLATTGGLTAFFAQQANTASAGAPVADTATGSDTVADAATADSTATPATAATASTATDATVVPSSSAATTPAAAGTAAASTAAAGTTAASTAAATTASTAVATAAATGTATYAGTAVSTRYGTVQVAVTVTNGAITDVKTLAAPSGGKNDRYTTMSVPVLRTEALAAQSADIDVVTGATYTSKGYITSLQSAIDKAVTAGVLASA